MDYQGLFGPSGAPIFPEGMAVSANTPAYGWKQWVKTPRLAIVEFVLDQLPHVGTAGQLLHLAVMQHYLLAPSRLHHEQVFFNIKNNSALDHHAVEMAKLAANLEQG